MQELNYQEVSEYVDAYLFNTEEWQGLNEQQRQKAINQAFRTLSNVIGDYYPVGIPVEHLAEQGNWIARIDNLVSKSEMGVTSLSIDGVSVSLAQRNNSICPFVLDAFGLSSNWVDAKKRKVARYSTYLGDSHRKGWV